MLETIRESWGWTGLRPVEILAQNSFGNVLVRDVDEKVWRICPEELSCEIVALNEAQYQELLVSDDFQRDWVMTRLVKQARSDRRREMLLLQVSNRIGRRVRGR